MIKMKSQKKCLLKLYSVKLTEEDAEAYLKELEDYELDKETLQKVAGGTLLWDTYFRETSK